MNKLKITYLFIFFFAGVLLSSCKKDVQPDTPDLALDYPNLLNVTHTAQGKPVQKQGYFTDNGSWMGFTIPDKSAGINGFCGPFDLDNRRWISNVIANLSVTDKDSKDVALSYDTAYYYPGRLNMKFSAKDMSIEQNLMFITAKHALLQCSSTKDIYFVLQGALSDSIEWSKESYGLVANLPKGEVLMLSFPDNVLLETTNGTYRASTEKSLKELNVVISYFNTKEDYLKVDEDAIDILKNVSIKVAESKARWNKYISSNLRSDVPAAYNRIMVKSIMTLMSNWRTPKGALFHSGIVPSHAMNYFVGFWAWDSWKHAVALSHIDIVLAKDQIRTMFDYQDEYGMIADCIYTDPEENNYRDSKPPLAAWAVGAVFKADGDTAFVAEMYPKLLKYHQWWYKYRDHDRNGICEYGATDGTLEAAKWESGMDNAIRFDDTKMLQNDKYAWSMDQESIDLNAYLVYEYKLLKEMAALLNQPFEEADRSDLIKDYFFDKDLGYFFDKTLKGDFVKRYGPEGWTPIWTQLASSDQVEACTKIMFDPLKFSTFIPFPTAAADDLKFMPRGYWRGPIWLDQVYFAISGLRKYGYAKEADTYTAQVFERLQGLNEDGAIHENYDVHTGERLKASHFSWSAAHLFLLFKEYGTK